MSDELTRKERRKIVGMLQRFFNERRYVNDLPDKTLILFKEELSRVNECDKTIEDGCGSVWPIECCNCGNNSMQVVRPGKVQCYLCG